MIGALPYFMENEEWYEFKEGHEFENGSNYVLTEKGKAIPEVVESYQQFVRDLDTTMDEDEERAEAMKLMGLN